MKVTVEGVTYDNISSACRNLGLKLNSIFVTKKRNPNMSYEQVFAQALANKKLITDSEGESFIFNNVEYPSFLGACKEWDININRVLKFSQNQEIDKLIALETLIINRIKYTDFVPPRAVNIMGICYCSYNYACSKLKISEKRVRDYSRGKEINYEQAIIEIINKKHKQAIKSNQKLGVELKQRHTPEVKEKRKRGAKGKTVLLGDIKYSSITEACTSLGIKRDTLQKYATYHNISAVEALPLLLERRTSQSFSNDSKC